MKIGLSLEVTRVLRNTWHSAINHEWYEFLEGHEICPLVCYGSYDVQDYDLIILCGGNDMPDIKTWRDNNYPKRDEFERKLIKDCIKHHIPLAGICRGSHFINYVLGGTHRLMETPYDNVVVDLEPFSVVCHHTITIDKLAPNCKATLVDNKGVIEMYQHKNLPITGIGWHPERNVNKHTRDFVFNLIKKDKVC